MHNDDFYIDDYCDECRIYGDDCFINDYGELEPYCPQCPMNPDRMDDLED